MSGEPSKNLPEISFHDLFEEMLALISLTRIVIDQELSDEAFVQTDKNTYDYFTTLPALSNKLDAKPAPLTQKIPYALAQPNVKSQSKPSSISQKPPITENLSPPKNPVMQEKSCNKSQEIPIEQISHAINDPIEQDLHYAHLILPLSISPSETLNLNSVQKKIASLYPTIRYVDIPLDDLMAYKKSELWKKPENCPEVAVISFNDSPPESSFANNVCRAIGQKICPSAFFSAYEAITWATLEILSLNNCIKYTFLFSEPTHAHVISSSLKRLPGFVPDKSVSTQNNTVEHTKLLGHVHACPLWHITESSKIESNSTKKGILWKWLQSLLQKNLP